MAPTQQQTNHPPRNRPASPQRSSRSQTAPPTQTETIAREMAVLLEPRRVAQEIGKGEKIGLGNRVRWALRDGHRAREKAARLEMSRNGLMAVMGNLHLRASAVPATRVVPSDPTSRPTTPMRAPSPVVDLGTLSSSLYTGDEKEGGELGAKKVRRSLSMSSELSEMLAWRRSKGKSVVLSELMGSMADSTFSSRPVSPVPSPAPSAEKIPETTTKPSWKSALPGSIFTIEENGERFA
ncbi:hypothetical protein AJ79_00115 [Helicocarpus griseus UAMH5409]|uniref:Uncharacterized protein n=1 Tax=Helicocarpus griseus UAMH5409 TaxID=1447875 RepID=A0A2B7YDE5_9EURO|nr:hypothetical protein AJ79_00115 [Helicocarpus griseus UAMH5409]